MEFSEIYFFSGFLFLIIIFLLVDLRVFNKKKDHSHNISAKEALIWTCIWVSLALCLYIFLFTNGNLLHDIKDNAQLLRLISKYEHPIKIFNNFQTNISIYNHNLALEYLTGYIIEYTLSVDNIFVIILIFLSFGVDKIYYHRVLLWGILGAIVLRFIFIFLCSALIQRFEFVMYFFGGLLIFAGTKMFINRSHDEKIEPEKHPVVKFASKYFAVYPTFAGHKFFVRDTGKLLITPLFLVLMVIEFSDLIFAVDSVPAVFSATKDPYIVFFSNIFAILGLRSLFFLLINIMDKFHYLKVGVSFLLVFVGVKMIFHHQITQWGFSTSDSLFVILFILVLSIFSSLIFKKKVQ
jgi:tellurite resistance protein TerC